MLDPESGGAQLRFGRAWGLTEVPEGVKPGQGFCLPFCSSGMESDSSHWTFDLPQGPVLPLIN